jgi:SEC-C motif-containing protein
MHCLCHSGKEYADCCKPYHEGVAAPTALALMRSRYSAYALHNIDYVMRTTHQAYRKKGAQWRKDLEQFSKTTQFIGLEILEDLPGEKESFVTFRALLEQGGNDLSFTEKSRFLKEKGAWYYCRSSADERSPNRK